MNDFLTTLAQTALDSSVSVQPRLASRFENTASEGMNELETMTDSSPSHAEKSRTTTQALRFSHQDQETETPQPTQADNALREPVFERLIEQDSRHDVAGEPNSPLLVHPITQTRTSNNFSTTEKPLISEREVTKLESPTVIHELREKEIVHHVHSSLSKHNSETITETLTKEKLLPVVQREMINLKLPETPMLQALVFIAESFNLECSGGLKCLHTRPAYDCCLVAIRRSPVNFGIGTGVEDREENRMPLTIINDRLWPRSTILRARAHRFNESI